MVVVAMETGYVYIRLMALGWVGDMQYWVALMLVKLVWDQSTCTQERWYLHTLHSKLIDVVYLYYFIGKHFSQT